MLFGWTIGAWLVVVVIPALLTIYPIMSYLKEKKEAEKDSDFYKEVSNERSNAN